LIALERTVCRRRIFTGRANGGSCADPYMRTLFIKTFACSCTGLGFWDTGLNPTPLLRRVEVVAGESQLG
jgi:hypothetical protein